MPLENGLALFRFNSGVGKVVRIGYLIRENEQSSWMVIEARGTLYGVVMRPFIPEEWHAWGRMEKYFNYSDIETIEEPIQITYSKVQIVKRDCYIRKDPEIGDNILGIAKRTTKYPYGGELQDNWVSIKYKDNIAWVAREWCKLS